jgi:hypothetical protein
MRRTDWPERLAEAIREGKGNEFTAEYYCVTFAADCVLAMTDVDYLEDYRGLSMEDALEKMKAAGHRSFYHYMVTTFGKPVPLAMAQRGDVIVRTKPELAAGICGGQDTWFASTQGLAFKPTLEQRWCFHV